MKYLLNTKLHCTNGSPDKDGGHVQTGLWLITLHVALIPHAPMHGSMHFCFMQAWFCKHSAFTTHSGLQAGGMPRYEGRHEQTA